MLEKWPRVQMLQQWGHTPQGLSLWGLYSFACKNSHWAVNLKLLFCFQSVSPYYRLKSIIAFTCPLWSQRIYVYIALQEEKEDRRPSGFGRVVMKRSVNALTVFGLSCKSCFPQFATREFPLTGLGIYSLNQQWPWKLGREEHTFLWKNKIMHARET